MGESVDNYWRKWWGFLLQNCLVTFFVFIMKSLNEKKVYFDPEVKVLAMKSTEYMAENRPLDIILMSLLALSLLWRNILCHASFLISYEHLSWQLVTSVCQVRAWPLLPAFSHSRLERLSVPAGIPFYSLLALFPWRLHEDREDRSLLLASCLVWVKPHVEGYPGVHLPLWRATSFSSVCIVLTLLHFDPRCDVSQSNPEPPKENLLQHVFTKHCVLKSFCPVCSSWMPKCWFMACEWVMLPDSDENAFWCHVHVIAIALPYCVSLRICAIKPCHRSVLPIVYLLFKCMYLRLCDLYHSLPQGVQLGDLCSFGFSLPLVTKLITFEV